MKVIAGNWKMNKTQKDTSKLISEIKAAADKSENLVIACVPFTDINEAVKAAKNSKVHIGAQNIHWANNGAFTGEISGEMLVEAGVEYVITGHSERRQYFGETNETVLKRTKAALSYGLKPIVCIGEKEDERESGNTERVLEKQIKEGFADISLEEIKNVIVAYEPVWAIGTGKTATANEANDAIAYIRYVFEKIYGEEIAKELIILYGGSMNEKNANELLSMPHIGGGLIGGASLVAEKFNKIIEAY